MERVKRPTLARLLLGASRARWLRRVRPAETAFANAGTWLRFYHELPRLAHTRPHNTRRADFIRSIHEFADYIATNEETVFPARVAARAEDLADAALPDELPLGLGHGDYAPRNARQVATAAGLPLPVVRKILKVLTREGLLASHRGSRGGYSLARSPEQISAAEMIAALDGPISLTDCAVHTGVCEQEASCHVREPWQRINAVVHHALSSVTLADLAGPAVANVAFHADEIPLSSLGLQAPEAAEP